MNKTPSVLLAALVLVGGANLAAYAAQGQPLLAGKSNSAAKSTTITSAKGPALTLKTKPTAPPLKVTSKQKVAKLNADQVDGLDGKGLQTNVRTYTLEGFDMSGAAFWDLKNLPQGDYLVSGTITFSTPNAVRCTLRQGTTDLLAGSGPSVDGQVEVQLQGWLRTGGTVEVACFGTSLTQVWTDYSNRITFLAVDGTTAVTGTNVPAL